MITEADIRKQAERRYDDFLRSLVTGAPFFPAEIRFGKRPPKGHYHAFSKKRTALLEEAAHVVAVDDGDASNVGRIASPDGYIVELEERRSRRYGVQKLPRRIYFGDADGYVRFLGRDREVRCFRAAVDATRREMPELLPWLERRAPRVLPYVDEWAGVLKVVRYFTDHPRPNLYARDLPLDVDTKFVERHAGILRPLLDFLLPEEAVDAGATDFARRFGLRFDEPLVRMRTLDPSHPLASSWPAEDVSMPVSSAPGLDGAGCTVVISENKMTFLTLPDIPRGLGIWGGGFQIDILRPVEWLRACDVLYWGDLDAHGFVILSRLRAFLPKARSVMMDVETFERFREYAVPGTPVDEHAAPHLTHAERAVYRSLAQTNLRLEQERIPQAYVVKRLYGPHSRDIGDDMDGNAPTTAAASTSTAAGGISESPMGRDTRRGQRPRPTPGRDRHSGSS